MMTSRTLTLKWFLFASATLLVALLDALAFSRISVFGFSPFVFPVMAALAASFEGPLQGSVYAMALGVLCDVTFTAPLPCVYTVSFTLCALAAAALSESVLRPGLLCSAVVSALSLFITASLCALILFFRRDADPSALFGTVLHEVVLSLPAVFLIHPLFSWIHKKFVF